MRQGTTAILLHHPAHTIIILLPPLHCAQGPDSSPGSDVHPSKGAGDIIPPKTRWPRPPCMPGASFGPCSALNHAQEPSGLAQTQIRLVMEWSGCVRASLTPHPSSQTGMEVLKRDGWERIGVSPTGPSTQGGAADRPVPEGDGRSRGQRQGSPPALHRGAAGPGGPGREAAPNHQQQLRHHPKRQPGTLRHAGGQGRRPTGTSASTGTGTPQRLRACTHVASAMAAKG